MTNRDIFPVLFFGAKVNFFRAFSLPREKFLITKGLTPNDFEAKPE